jgi:hypothetical protein
MLQIERNVQISQSIVSLFGNNWEQRQLHSSIECIPHTRARTLRSITLCFCRFAALKASFLLRGRRSTWWWLAWLLWLQRRVALINQWCLLLRIATVVLHQSWFFNYTSLQRFSLQGDKSNFSDYNIQKKF